MPHPTQPGNPCPFCAPDPRRIIHQDRHCFAMRDNYPVSPGHSLIIPRRHIPTWFATRPIEQTALMQAMATVKQGIDRQHAPAAYNIGINDGPAAGQTIPHLHIHLIPRYPGDKENPRGGVRWIFPERAVYWEGGE